MVIVVVDRNVMMMLVPVYELTFTHYTGVLK